MVACNGERLSFIVWSSVFANSRSDFHLSEVGSTSVFFGGLLSLSGLIFLILYFDLIRGVDTTCFDGLGESFGMSMCLTTDVAGNLHSYSISSSSSIKGSVISV